MLSFTLFTLGVSALPGLFAMACVYAVEDRFIADQLSRAAMQMQQRHRARGAMRDVHGLGLGRPQAHEQMIIDTVRDHRVLLDGLVAQPRLDARRIVAAGYSMGAQGALLLAGLDERVHAVAAMVPPHAGDNVAAVPPSS